MEDTQKVQELLSDKEMPDEDKLGMFTQFLADSRSSGIILGALYGTKACSIPGFYRIALKFIIQLQKKGFIHWNISKPKDCVAITLMGRYHG